jgi:hypothetical protein
VIGTHHLLGVCQNSCSDLSIPDNLAKVIKDSETEVYGKFTVCPFGDYKEGEMQMVCIESVEITKVVEAK